MGGSRAPTQPGPTGEHGLWTFSAAFLSVLGLAGGVMTWGLTGVVVSSLAMSMACWCLIALGDLGGPARPVRTAAAYGIGVTCMLGLLAVGELGGLLLVLALVVTSPHVGWVRRWWAAGRSPRGEPGMTPAVQSLGEAYGAAGGNDAVGGGLPSRSLPAEEGLADLDDLQLCLAWRRSFLPLSSCRDASTFMAIVRLRQTYLDELTRRHPDEMARWFESGARAAGNPMRFINGDADGPAAAGS